MIGNNKLHFNEGTMKEIVQEWLDCNLFYPAEVTGISVESEHGCKTFVIALTSQPRKKEDDISQE